MVRPAITHDLEIIEVKFKYKSTQHVVMPYKVMCTKFSSEIKRRKLNKETFCIEIRDEEVTRRASVDIFIDDTLDVGSEEVQKFLKDNFVWFFTYGKRTTIKER